MFKKNLIILSVLLSCYNLNANASNDREENLIEFQGVIKPVIGFIAEAVLAPDTHPFSITDVYEYQSENTLYKLGSVLNLSEQALDKIGQGNFVYSSFYKLEKTHLSHGDYVEIPLIIVGTQDSSIIGKFLSQLFRESLYFYSFRFWPQH